MAEITKSQQEYLKDSETNHLVLKDGMKIPLGDIVELEEIEDSPLDSV